MAVRLNGLPSISKVTLLSCAICFPPFVLITMYHCKTRFLFNQGFLLSNLTNIVVVFTSNNHID